MIPYKQHDWFCMHVLHIYIHMDTDKTNTKIKIIQKQSTPSDSNDDTSEYGSEMANIIFKEHLEQLKLKVQMINDKPSTLERIYGYFQMNIGALIFWWL